MHLTLVQLEFAVFALYAALAAAAIVDCRRSNNQNKAGWMALIICLPILGSILYFGFATGRFVSEL